MSGGIVTFVIEAILLGVALAMDAFSVSVANALGDLKMKRSKGALIAGTFAFFQVLMPMIGWFFVHYLCEFFTVFEKFIPWIALGLLLFIGIKMIVDAVKEIKAADADKKEDFKPLGLWTLLVQGVATSIDALSVGFTIEQYSIIEALICSLIIAAVTFIICVIGLLIGRTVGSKFADKATIVGGIILILIGLEIWITGVL